VEVELSHLGRVTSHGGRQYQLDEARGGYPVALQATPETALSTHGAPLLRGAPDRRVARRRSSGLQDEREPVLVGLTQQAVRLIHHQQAQVRQREAGLRKEAGAVRKSESARLPAAAQQRTVDCRCATSLRVQACQGPWR